MSYNKRSINSLLIGLLLGLSVVATGFAGYYAYSHISYQNDKPIISTNDNQNGATDKDLGKQTSEVNNSLGNEDIIKSSNTQDISSSLPSQTPVNNANPFALSSDFIFPNSSHVKLTDFDLKPLTKEYLALARNEIFARHGYVFQTEPYKSYFRNKTWYKPNPSFKEGELNEIEVYNIQLIIKHEKSK